MQRGTTVLRSVVMATAAGALLLAGCRAEPTTSMSSSEASSPAVRADFNDADVAFVEMMYPHHSQALEMAALVPTRSQNPEVLGLATRIDRSQYGELWQIIGLLRNFGKPVPDGMAAMGDMPGLMSAERMSSLEGLSGRDFDSTWLSMMIEHHDGAIVMSQAALEHGINPNTRGLADGIIVSQQPEIGQMRRMLG